MWRRRETSRDDRSISRRIAGGLTAVDCFSHGNRLGDEFATDTSSGISEQHGIDHLTTAGRDNNHYPSFPTQNRIRSS